MNMRGCWARLRSVRPKPARPTLQVRTGSLITALEPALVLMPRWGSGALARVRAPPRETHPSNARRSPADELPRVPAVRDAPRAGSVRRVA
jgi:hypothetical protein